MTLSQGQRLGRYEIIAPLGAGGMGEVYRARDERLDREVAVKVLPESVARDSERLARFGREARAVAALSHPNILEIHDYATEGEITYAVTELLEGQTLRERIARGRTDWRTAVTICAAIADGLAAAHRRKIVHRDLKPENVFMTDDEQVKILDFGLAKLVRNEPEADSESQPPTATLSTRPGAVMGTVGYMSPEQVGGEALDHRTDIFALGCLVHELLCGQRTFPGGSRAEVATAILTRQPTPLRQAGCDAGPELQAIVDRCLEKTPAKRFQDASDLSFALRSLISSGSGGEAPEPTAVRRWHLLAAVGVAIAALVTVLILFGDRHEKVPAGGHSGLDPNLVAAAPFDNRTGKPELDHLGLVAADWLANTLAQIDTITVVPIGLGLDPRARGASPQEVAEATGAGIVVTGSFHLDGDAVRFQATLTDAIQGSLLRSLDPSSAPVGQPMAAIELLGHEVAGAVATLFASWDKQVDRNLRPPNFEAYREYTTGLAYFGADGEKTLEHFRRASEIDADFVAPQLLAAGVLRATFRHAEAAAIIEDVEGRRQRMNSFEQHWLDYNRAMLEGDVQRAVQHMRRCVAIAPRSVVLRWSLAQNLSRIAHPREALTVVSTIESFDAWAGTGPCTWPLRLKADMEHVLGYYDDELESARRAIEVCGASADLARRQASALAAGGRLDGIQEVLDEGMQAPDARRLSLALLVGTACELEAHGHPAVSARIAGRAVEVFEQHRDIETATEWQRLLYVQAHVMLGHLDAANQVLIALNEELPGDDDVLGWLGIVSAHRGDVDAAERYSEQLRHLDRPYLFGWDSYYRAAIAAHLGRHDEALSLLRGAFSEGFPWRVSLHSNLELKPLRGHPGLEAILHPEG